MALKLRMAAREFVPTRVALAKPPPLPPPAPARDEAAVVDADLKNALPEEGFQSAGLFCPVCIEGAACAFHKPVVAAELARAAGLEGAMTGPAWQRVDAPGASGCGGKPGAGCPAPPCASAPARRVFNKPLRSTGTPVAGRGVGQARAAEFCQLCHNQGSPCLFHAPLAEEGEARVVHAPAPATEAPAAAAAQWWRSPVAIATAHAKEVWKGPSEADDGSTDTGDSICGDDTSSDGASSAAAVLAAEARWHRERYAFLNPGSA